MEQVLHAFALDSDLERLEDLMAEFNLFDVLGISRREINHSAVLAWLLNPNGSHRLRDYFLRNFLSQTAAEARKRGILTSTQFDIDSWNLRDVQVATEHYNIDILLIGEKGGFVCLIENKIGSNEHSDQLTRYLDTVNRKYAGLTVLPVFLTPYGTEPRVEQYVPFSYEMVACLIERTLKMGGSTISKEVNSFLKQYLSNLDRYVLDTVDNIDKLAYHLYHKHSEAIRRISRARAWPDKMIWNIVESAIRRYAPDLQHVRPNQQNWRRFSPLSLRDIVELRQGTCEVRIGNLVLFEFICDNKALDLYCTVDSHLQVNEIHERIKELVQTNWKPWNSKGIRSGGDAWYWKHILSKQDHSPFHLDRATHKIERAIRDFYKNDYWWLINNIRQAFGYPLINSPE